MEFKTIRFEQQENIVTVWLNRPGQKNATSAQMTDELQKAFHKIEDESTCRMLVIRGDNGMFSCGIDLRDFPADQKPDVYGFSKWERMLRTLERLPVITIAAIEAECAGGGMQVALACDVRVAAKDAVFHLYEARFGFLPGMSVFRLAKFIGLGRARRMALTGRRVNAAEAERIGLVDHLCEKGELEKGIQNAMSEFPDLTVEAIELIRRLLDESFEMSYEDFVGGFLAAQQSRYPDHAVFGANSKSP